MDDRRHHGDVDNSDSHQLCSILQCRAVAAFVLGDPNAVEPIVSTAATRFTMLRDQDVDMVSMTTTHNFGRDTWEDHAMAGCTYSVRGQPYLRELR
jgi:general L-amino acid transport system substrate-binding protein